MKFDPLRFWWIQIEKNLSFVVVCLFYSFQEAQRLDVVKKKETKQGNSVI